MRKPVEKLFPFTLLSDAETRTALVRTACDLVTSAYDLNVSHIIFLDSQCSPFEDFFNETWKLIHPQIDPPLALHLHRLTPNSQKSPELASPSRVILIGSSNDVENLIDATESILRSSYPYMTIVDRVDSERCRVPVPTPESIASTQYPDFKILSVPGALQREVKRAVVEFKRTDKTAKKLGREWLDYEKEQLVIKAISGDINSIEKLLRENHTAAFRYALSLCRDRDKAEDLVAETNLKAMNNIGKLSAPRAFVGWYRKTMYRIFMDRLRSKIVTNEEPLDEIHHGSRQVVLNDDTNFNFAIELLERRLPKEQFEVLYWVGLQGLSYQEYADQAGIPTGTVRSRLHAARETARAVWRSIEDSGD